MLELSLEVQRTCIWSLCVCVCARCMRAPSAGMEQTPVTEAVDGLTGSSMDNLFFFPNFGCLLVGFFMAQNGANGPFYDLRGGGGRGWG